jgi:hypothetical protein
MPLFMDVHSRIERLTGGPFGGAHHRDLAVQGDHGVQYLNYWYDEDSGKVFCLAAANAPLADDFAEKAA